MSLGNLYKTKICCKCKIEKHIESFYKENKNFSRRKSICKDCDKERGKTYRSKKRYDSVEEGYKICKLCKSNLHIKEFYKNRINPDGLCKMCKICDRIKKYKISKQEYLELKLKQNNCCAICKEPEKEDKCLYIDHCHKTGKIRGLLCSQCNCALGNLKDNIETAENLIEYLKNEKYNPNC